MPLRRTASHEDTAVRAYKYRLYPNREQAELLHKTFGCARKVYNLLLSERLDLYRRYKDDPDELRKQKLSTPAALKAEYSYLREVDSLALCNAQCNLEAAFSAFFSGRSAIPTFKKKRRARLAYTTNNVSDSIRIDSGRLRLPKVGYIKIKRHRPMPEGSVIKSVTVSCTGSGKYYASILVETTTETPYAHAIESVIGLDYSSKELYADSQGASPEYPHYYRKGEGKLAKEQRKLSRKKKFSKNWHKQKRRVAKEHEKTANRRKDFLNKLSYKLANEYDAVVVESIDMKTMSQGLRLGKSTYDNGFGMFRNMLRYKLADRGKWLIEADRYYPSSKLCSVCGYKNAELTLSDRVWKCPSCGTILDRDVNAAVNIRDEGIRILGINNRGAHGDSLPGETLHAGMPAGNRKPPLL